MLLVRVELLLLLLLLLLAAEEEEEGGTAVIVTLLHSSITVPIGSKYRPGQSGWMTTIGGTTHRIQTSELGSTAGAGTLRCHGSCVVGTRTNITRKTQCTTVPITVLLVVTEFISPASFILVRMIGGIVTTIGIAVAFSFGGTFPVSAIVCVGVTLRRGSTWFWFWLFFFYY